MAILELFDDVASIGPNVEAFLESETTSSNPTLVQGRQDLKKAVRDAEQVYSEPYRRPPVDVGYLLDKCCPWCT